MFELIIIISLAIIFFIFLNRMPEVEKIKSEGPKKKVQAFRPDLKGLRKLLNYFKKFNLNKIKIARMAVDAKSPRPRAEQTQDLHLEAEKKLRFGDLEAAEKLYLRLAVVAPQDATVYAALGKIYLERLNYNDAIASYKAAINRDRKNGFYYYDLAAVLFKAERFKEAIICYEKSILINNRIPIRHLGLGLSLMKIGEYERAADSFQRAILVEPNNQRYRILLKKAEAKRYKTSLN